SVSRSRGSGRGTADSRGGRSGPSSRQPSRTGRARCSSTRSMPRRRRLTVPLVVQGRDLRATDFSRTYACIQPSWGTGRPPMTAQISDVVVYRGRPHGIAGVNGSGLFDPREHGIRPTMISTACWRGYHCTYEVAEGCLLLTTVNLGLGPEDQAPRGRGGGPQLFRRGPNRHTPPRP